MVGLIKKIFFALAYVTDLQKAVILMMRGVSACSDKPLDLLVCAQNHCVNLEKNPISYHFSFDGFLPPLSILVLQEFRLETSHIYRADAVIFGQHLR